MTVHPHSSANASKSKVGRVAGLFKTAFQGWIADQSTRSAASLAYYTAFSIAPLLILLIAAAGLIFGRDAAQGRIVHEISGLVGPQSAGTIQSMIQAAQKPSEGIVASIISVTSLLAGAAGVVSELKNALNRIWNTGDPHSLKGVVKQNARIYGIVMGIGFLLLVSLVITAAMAAAGKFIDGILPLPEVLLHAANLVLSLGVITILFSCMFKYIPNAVMAWRDVWAGAALTAFLFTVGKFAIGLYLGKGTVGSSYGTAGSVLVVLLWVYYSGLILYFGAEFTKAYAQSYGSRAQTAHKSSPPKKEI